MSLWFTVGKVPLFYVEGICNMQTYCKMALFIFLMLQLLFYSFLELNLTDIYWSLNFASDTLLNHGVLWLLSCSVIFTIHRGFHFQHHCRTCYGLTSWCVPYVQVFLPAWKSLRFCNTNHVQNYFIGRSHWSSTAKEVLWSSRGRKYNMHKVSWNVKQWPAGQPQKLRYGVI
jgi:hypothetical protein